MLAPALFERVLESAPDATVIIDDAGRIVFVNAAAQSMFGYRREQMLGEPIELLLPPSQRLRHGELRAGFLAAPRTRAMGVGLDLRARRCDGSELAVEIALSPVSGAIPQRVIAAIRDVGEGKRMEAQLGAAREAAERARQAADEARDLADRADQAKSRFLARASHDLRQPLQSLALLNGTLRRMGRDPALREVLERQEHAIGAMSRLVNALLDICKLESGAVQPQIGEFAVLPLLEQLQQEFIPLAQAKGLALRFAAQAGTLRTDAALLEQVLRNLLSNALKYTPSGEISLRCAIEPPVARLEVCDTGIGIAQEQLPLIFGEFFQVDTPANVPSAGYGLGLSIVSRIVDLLGLKVEVESAPGCGSCFRVRVPTGVQALEKPPRVPDRSADPGRARPGRAPRILLIEDEHGVRSATEGLLRAAGYEVVGGASQDDAFAQLRQCAHIDLLISDFHLAGRGTGIEVIAAVRAQVGPDLPVILLSGDTSIGVQGLAHDARWRIARKPLRAEALLALIGELLGG